MTKLAHRSDLVADQLAHLPYGSRRFAPNDPPVRIGTTGTGDDLLILAWSATELHHEKAAGARILQQLGIAPGMRVANTLAGALVTPGSLLVGDVIEEIGALDIPLGATDSDAGARGALDLFDRVEPEVVIVDQATATKFFAVVGDRPRAWWRGIVWLRRGNEAWKPSAPPAVFSGWQRRWLAVPEVACFAGGECAQGRLHVDPTLDPSVIDAGLVMHASTRDLRYATGIGAAAVACDCGTPGPAFSA